MKRSAILFDLDDTLIDRNASIQRYTSLLVRDFAQGLSSHNPELLVPIVRKCDHGGYRPRAEVSVRLTQTLPWKTPPDSDALLAHWREHFPSSSVLRTHAEEVLRILQSRGMSIGMVTNGSTVGQNRKIDTLGLRPYFSSIVISETVGIKKPAVAIFEKALAELQKRPEETWFVGDNPRNDVIGAAHVGLAPIWLKGCHLWPEDEPAPARQITGLEEIPAMLSLA